MKNNSGKIAVSTIVVIIILMGFDFHNGSVDGVNGAYATINAASPSPSWVRLKYDNGTEFWKNLKTGNYGHKELLPWGMNYVYINRKENLRWEYTPSTGEYIKEDRPLEATDGHSPVYEPQTAWGATVGKWEKIVQDGGSADHKVEIHNETLNNNPAVRFDIYYIDGLDNKTLTRQTWADPVTKLPIKTRVKQRSLEQTEKGREYVNGEYSFPESGPNSIYDLDVPQHLPIARTHDKKTDPAIEKIFEQAKPYYEKFPKRYRLVMWEEDRKGTITEVWRNGENAHLNYYYMINDDAKRPLDTPLTAERVIEWIKNHSPDYTYIYDGERSYRRNSMIIPKVSVQRSCLKHLPEGALFIEKQWRYMDRDPQVYSVITDAPEELKKYIGIRNEEGTIRRDYYIDSERDYICIRDISWKLQEGQWKKEHEDIDLEINQLPTGQWYVSKRKAIQFPVSDKRYIPGDYNYGINVVLIDEGEFPPDTFTGEILLKGAKVEPY